jgi:hypothetical protein
VDDPVDSSKAKADSLSGFCSAIVASVSGLTAVKSGLAGSESFSGSSPVLIRKFLEMKYFIAPVMAL